MHAEYQEMKKNAIDFLNDNDSNFSFTVDGWTAANMSSFCGITIHFIDILWNLISFALNLVPINGKHRGSDTADFVYNTLKTFGVEKKIQGITCDNARVNDTFMEKLQEKLKEDGIFVDIHDKHFKCLDHVINLGVQAILVNISEKYVETRRGEEYLDLEDNDDQNYDDEDDEDEVFENGDLRDIFLRIRQTCKKIRKSGQLRIYLKGFCEMKGN